MGIFIAFSIICMWALHLFFILNSVQINLLSLNFYLHILLQGYLYTGLFITAHDAMHKTVTKNRYLNEFIGVATAFLFAGMSYKKLKENHFKHHKYPGSKDDPDFYVKSQNFFKWWISFLLRYSTVLQIVIMAAVFNLLKLWFDELNIWIFWVLPAFIGAIQLFYFGTYLPHKKPHDHDMDPHKARTQNKNHIWAMLSCYFFGYHFEHHDSPSTPWWQLYKLKR